MAFPTSPSNGDEYTNALGTVYKYLTADDKWYIISADVAHSDTTGRTDSDHHAKYTDNEAVTALNARLAIGTANAKWKPCTPGPAKPPGTVQSDGYNISNVGATDFVVNWYIPLSPTLDALKLYIKSVEVGLQDADGGDYVDILYLFNMSAHGTRNTFFADGTNRTAAGTYTYNAGAPYDMSASKSMWLLMGCVVTNAGDLDMSVVRVEYYYDT